MSGLVTSNKIHPIVEPLISAHCIINATKRVIDAQIDASNHSSDALKCCQDATLRFLFGLKVFPVAGFSPGSKPFGLCHVIDFHVRQVGAPIVINTFIGGMWVTL